jgi:hypothetical protein
MPHTRHYQVKVNGEILPCGFSIDDPISDSHIQNMKSNFVAEQMKLGTIKYGDNIQFIFKYATS